jgi:hypothetical protein
MPLLSDIQTALLSDQAISPILLKLRFLAARLGSVALEDWVRHESEGYPPEVEVPDYRRMGIGYTGSFHNPVRQVQNLAIPAYVINELAGKEWLVHQEKQSISAIESLMAVSLEKGTNPIVPYASNLVPIIGDKMLSNMHCLSVVGTVSRASMVELQHVLRNRILELTIQLEAKIPGITLIDIAQGTTTANPKEYAAVTNVITNNTVYGNQANTNVGDVGGGSSVEINVQQGDAEGLRNSLREIGLNEPDASELAAIVASEKPTSPKEPIGKKAAAWLLANAGKVVEKVGFTAAATLTAEAIGNYYGLS